MSSADAFILVYDVCDSSTFEEMRSLRDEIHEIKNTQQVPIVVVGNKIDIANADDNLRQVIFLKPYIQHPVKRIN